MLVRPMWEDFKFKSHLGNLVRPCLNIKNLKRAADGAQYEGPGFNPHYWRLQKSDLGLTDGIGLYKRLQRAPSSFPPQEDTVKIASVKHETSHQICQWPDLGLPRPVTSSKSM